MQAVTVGNFTSFSRTDSELEAAWNNPAGEGHRLAVERGDLCHVRACDRETALAISRFFVEEFARPSCCHYDGETLSIYCGSIASQAEQLLRMLESVRLVH